MNRRVVPNDGRPSVYSTSSGSSRSSLLRLKNGGVAYPASVSFDIQKAASWAQVVFLAALVVLVLVGLLIYTGSKHTVTKVEESVIVLGHTASRAINISKDVARAVGDVNMTRIIERTISKDEDDWVNATTNAKRSLNSVSRIIQSADETQAIQRYSDLAHTITGVLSSPKVAGAIEKYSDTAIWAMELMQTEETKTAIGVAKQSLVRIADTVQSPETHEMINKFINGEPATELLHTTRDLVNEWKRTLSLINDIIDQVKEQDTVEHVTDLIKTVKRDQVVEKVVDAYDKFGVMEQKFESIAARSLEFVAGLLSQDDNNDKK